MKNRIRTKKTCFSQKKKKKTSIDLSSSSSSWARQNRARNRRRSDQNHPTRSRTRNNRRRSVWSLVILNRKSSVMILVCSVNIIWIFFLCAAFGFLYSKVLCKSENMNVQSAPTSQRDMEYFVLFVKAPVRVVMMSTKDDRRNASSSVRFVVRRLNTGLTTAPMKMTNILVLWHQGTTTTVSSNMGDLSEDSQN